MSFRIVSVISMAAVAVAFMWMTDYGKNRSIKTDKPSALGRSPQASEGAESEQASTSPVAVGVKDHLVEEVPLTEAEESRFYAEVERVFRDVIVSTTDQVSLNNDLSNLNALGRPAVVSALRKLSERIERDEDVFLRLSLVDYLSYRSKWDPWAREEILRFVERPYLASLDAKMRGPELADRAELMAAVAKYDLEGAKDVLRAIEDPLLQRIAAHEMRLNLRQDGRDDPALATLSNEQ